MKRVNSATWTKLQDREMLIEILHQARLVPRHWESVSSALGPLYSPNVCQERFKLLMTLRDLSQQDDEGIPSIVAEVDPPMSDPNSPSEHARSVRETTETSDTLEMPEDEGTVWDQSESEEEAPTPQPKKKKRKSNRQGGNTSIPVVEVDVDEETAAEFVDIDTLRTPRGQRTSNISYTRTNTVQKNFAPALGRVVAVASGALPANGAAPVPARQANATRQQTPARPTTSNGRTSGNANHNQDGNNFRGRGGGRGGFGNANGNGNGGNGNGNGIAGNRHNTNRGNQRNINNGRFQRFN